MTPLELLPWTPPLSPFFSYFGSKHRLSGYYPRPEFDEIVEPFAGSAGYALRYHHHTVRLYDTYEPVVEVWDWLIHVSEKEVLALPLGPFTKDHPIESEVQSIPARTLIGFWLSESQTSPSRYPQSPSRHGGWSGRKRRLIAAQLRFIRHWRVELKSYESIPNRPATWFIDPPYEEAGGRYKHSAITYPELAEWCRGRSGQRIVCEQNTADWLPFKPLRSVNNGSNEPYVEALYQMESEK